MISSAFSPTQLAWLLPSATCLLLSLAFFLKGKNTWAVGLLLLGGLALRFFMLASTPFLYTWDEQFHVMVAKNMMAHPFKPMLYELLPFEHNYLNWVGVDIWLHKQPLFMWQMALSMKIFGANEFAARLPSALMTTLLIWVIYRMGKRTLSPQAGYLGAFLFALANYQLELVCGNFGMDHNDVAFMFYITLSIWSWIEYQHSGKRHWIYLIGLFSGFAILNKWLVGILVYSGWGMNILLDSSKRTRLKAYLPMLTSALITVIVALPWQLYTLLRFPEHFAHEFELNGRHFTEVIEKHAGGWWYYFEHMHEIYGNWIPFVIVIAFYFLFKRVKTKAYGIAYATYVILVYAFFTVAKTKLISFTLVLTPIFYLAVGCLFYQIYLGLKPHLSRRILLPLSLIVVAWFGFLHFDQESIQAYHVPQPGKYPRWIAKAHNAEVYRSFQQIDLSGVDVMLNCPKWEPVSFMFYAGVTGYSGFPDLWTYKRMKESGRRLGMLETGVCLPDYLNEDTTIQRFEVELKPL